MKARMLYPVTLCAMLIANCVVAQETFAMPEPTKEHQILSRFVGEWSTKVEANMGPEQPPMECSGTLSSRMLGGFWVLNEMKGDMQGVPMNSMQTIGYDESKKKYVGTWVDSVSAFMWKYQGTLDKAGKVLTLEAEGPNFTDPTQLTKFQDIYEFASEDEIKMMSKMLGADGKWVSFMKGTFTRIKKK